jgi:hypothetical protein
MTQMNANKMKTIFKQALSNCVAATLLAMIWILGGTHANGQSATKTGFTALFVNPDGTAMTNQVLFYPWPLPTFQFFVVGTNIVNGNYVVTNQPNITPNQIIPGAAGYFTNAILPGQYVVKIPALGNTAWAYAQIPAVAPGAVQIPLSSCISNAPAFYVDASNYSYFTNLFGAVPATNSFAGIVNPLGYIPQPSSGPLTNLASGTTISLTNGVYIEWLDSLGQYWQSNTATHQWFSISNETVWYDGFQQPTNFVDAFDPTNSANIALTNAMLFAKSNILSSSQTAGLGGDGTNAPGGTNFTLALVAPASAGGTATKITYNAKGLVTGTNVLSMSDLPAYVASPLNVGTNDGSTVFSVVTNGPEVWISYQTNNNPGPAFTNYPWGTICLTTNGTPYVLSNMVWRQF